MEDTIGNRIKTKYEDVFRISIPQRTYAILRIDGKAFHTFTRGLEKPYCQDLANSLDTAAMALCKEMMGAQFAYGQSDEYSFLMTDFENDKSEMWFNGNIQKIASVSASIFTAHFNEMWDGPKWGSKLAMFDARLFVIPSRTEVENYFIWRQLDASRNSLNMLASCHFSHKQLHGKNSADKHEMLHSVGVNWNNCDADIKRGRVISRQPNKRIVTFTHKKTKEVITQEVEENAWVVDKNIPVFTKTRPRPGAAYLDGLIPVQS
jgi:tRNA(His) 5'-end guanylyltransferase